MWETNLKQSGYMYQLSSVTQSCLTLCDPMDCSMPDFPAYHQLLEFTQTHIHRVIQTSHPLSFPSPLAFNHFQHQGLFQGQFFTSGGQSIGASASASSSEYSGLIFFRIDWFDLLAIQGTLKSLLQQFKSINYLVLSFLYSSTLTSVHDYWKNHSFD